MAGSGGLAAPASRSMRNSDVASLITSASCLGGAPFCCLLGPSAGRKPQPVPLVDERNCQQEHSEHDEADDAVDPIELGDVIDEYLHDRCGDEQKSLPANESRAPEKSDDHQHGAVSHPQCREGEVALDLDAA